MTRLNNELSETDKMRLSFIENKLGEEGSVRIVGVNFSRENGKPTHEGILTDMSYLGYVYTVTETNNPREVIVGYYRRDSNA